MQSYRIHTASETKTVTIEPGYEDTMIVHVGPSPGVLQGLDLNRPRALRMADKNRQEKKP